jgi:hypothetical protein
MKHSTLRIKPRVMKRQWKSMPMKRKNNIYEVQHVEASFSLLPLNVVEVFQLCSHHVHEVEEATSLNDDIEEHGEDVHASTPLADKDKEMIINDDGIMKKPLDMVDDPIGYRHFHIDWKTQMGS